MAANIFTCRLQGESIKVTEVKHWQPYLAYLHHAHLQSDTRGQNDPLLHTYDSCLQHASYM